jgi:hypothetical protein
MDNFYFLRPEISHENSIGMLFFHKDEEYFKWKKLQHYLFHNYDIPEYNNGKFNFTAYGSPIYGVVGGVLQLIPLEDDAGILKPELIPHFKDVWFRMGNNNCDNPIKDFSITELHDIFNLKDYNFEDTNYKFEGNFIKYKHEHTFYKNW